MMFCVIANWYLYLVRQTKFMVEEVEMFVFNSVLFELISWYLSVGILKTLFSNKNQFPNTQKTIALSNAFNNNNKLLMIFS